MQQGKKYLIRYRAEGFRYDRRSVMIFLGEEGTDYIFDARPTHGTQRMPKPWVVSAHVVADDTEPYCGLRWKI